MKAAPGGDLAVGPRSLARILHILEHLGGRNDGMTLAELCRALDAPKSSVFSLLRELVALGYLVRQGGQYRIGYEAIRLATAIIGRRSSNGLIQSVLGDLSEKTGLTIMYSEFLPDDAVMVHRQVVQSTRTIRYVAQVGSRRPMDNTATGRAVLPFTPEDWYRKYLLDRFGPRPAKKEATARRELEEIVRQVRRDGYSICLGEFTAGVGAFAAPVLDSKGHAVATVGISGPEAELRREADYLVSLLPQAAGQIARILSNASGGAGE